MIFVSIIKKLVEYSLEELEMAEKYCKLALHCEDPVTSQKFNEIAKDEIRHYEFLKSVLKKEETEMTKDGTTNRMGADVLESYKEILDEKKDRIMYKINNFQPKK